jgi:cyclohexyl-isocyanide hydratase
MPTRIGFLLFPDVQQLDLTGPYEILASLADTEVYLVARDLQPVKSVTGLQILPTTTLRDCPPLDVVCVPGGKGINALLEDEEVLAFVRRQAANARYVTSVCTGALVLGAAGLLKGKRATTHWSAQQFLAAFGAVPVHERVVRDGSLLTGAGVTAGIDFALTLAAELSGRAAAEAVQLSLEYSPAPPFDAGTPDSAPPEILARVRSRTEPLRAARQRLVEAWVARQRPAG